MASITGPSSTSGTRSHVDCAPSTSGRVLGQARRTKRREPAVRAHVASQHAPIHDFSAWRGERASGDAEIAATELAMLMPGAGTAATPVLSAQKVFDRLYNAVHAHAHDHFGAFYSSELGGIVTNPAFMLVHMDDHMVHAAHAVFDTVMITDGYLYMLDHHVARFNASAAAAGISLPGDAEVKRILLDTAAASKKMNGIVKFWASPGRGGFGVSASECLGTTLYALASSETAAPVDRTIGLAACASPIPPKAAAIATIKGTNYLPNVLAKSHAEENGMQTGVFVDEDGYVLEGPNSNFGMVTEDDVFVTPPFDRCVAGVTIQNLMQLIPTMHMKFPSDVLVHRIEQRPIHCDEVLAAKEAFLVDTGMLVSPIVSWNGHLIADGRPGVHALAFANMLENDRLPAEGCMSGNKHHTEVPYGYVTGMRGQLI